MKKQSLLILLTLMIIFNALECHPVEFNKRQQIDAISTPSISSLRSLPWGQVNFIHTTDTHGWLEGHVAEGAYNGDLGDLYSFTIKMKQKARRMKKDIFIVDTGDTHDGNGLSDVTNPRGKVSQPLLEEIPYDILTIGNHELYANDVTLDVAKNFAPYWKDRYLTSNVYITDVNNNKTVPIGAKFAYFEGEFGTRVLAYGFLFNFRNHGNVSVVQTVQDEIQQPWFLKSLKDHDPTLITLIGHIGIRFDEFYTLIRAIRAVYPKIPIAVLGGHTHTRDAVKYDDFAAGIESGRYMETIGFFSLEISENNVTFSRRYLDQNRATYIYHSVDGNEKRFDTKRGRSMTNHITQLRKKYKLSKRLGCAPQDYRLSAANPQSNSSVFYLLTEEVLPKVVAKQNQTNLPYFLINTGGVRYDIFKGPFSIDNMYQLSPFEDAFFCIKNVPIDIVKQILPQLNKEGEAMKKRDVWPHNIVERQVHFESSRVIYPGYVTTDDFGNDGDDTKHSAVPDYPLPAFVANNVPQSKFADIIYLDFFDVQLRALLLKLSNKNWTAVEKYNNVTSSTMWIEFSKANWQNCS